MINYNAENERIKSTYFTYLKEANQKADSTINGVRKSILRYEEYTRFKHLKFFNKDRAMAFKKGLMTTKAKLTGETLAKSTILSTLNNLKAFFVWLGSQPSFKSCIHIPDIQYLNLSEKETRAAKAAKTKDIPTLEQVRKALFAMPHESEIEKRDRALVAFTILTGIRDSAITSLKLKHIDLHNNYVNQDPNEVKTKFSKKIDTYFFPIGDDIKAIFTDWVTFLRTEKFYGLNEPLFPQTRLAHDKNQAFTPSGLEPKHWSNATAIRKIFKQAFERVELSYYSPHKFRDTLTHIGQARCTSAEDFKAWSQNLGHENVLTTLTSYGTIAPHRQGELIKGLGEKKEEDKTNEEIMSFLKKKLGD